MLSSRSKNKKLRDVVCKKLIEKFGIDIKNEEEFNLFFCGEGEDIKICNEKLDKLYSFFIRCKNSEFFDWNFIRQVRENNCGNKYWALVIKRNRDNPVIVMDLDIFLDFIIKGGK